MSNSVPEFSVTFWIRVAQNRSWTNPFSTIRFPPLTIKDGVKVYSAKYNENFKVFILHPEYGYRKITVNAKKYLGKDTFVVITVKGSETKLYLNADLVSTVEREEMVNSLEVGDFVMVQVQKEDLKNLRLPPNTSIILPAEIGSFKNDMIAFNFFELNEVAILPAQRLVA